MTATVVELPTPPAADTDEDQPTGLSSQQVMAEAGITYRQLDFWVRAGYVQGERLTSRGSGQPRRWTDDERDYVVTLARLVHAGIPLSVAATALATTSTLPVEINLGHGVTLRIEAR